MSPWLPRWPEAVQCVVQYSCTAGHGAPEHRPAQRIVRGAGAQGSSPGAVVESSVLGLGRRRGGVEGLTGRALSGSRPAAVMLCAPIVRLLLAAGLISSGHGGTGLERSMEGGWMVALCPGGIAEHIHRCTHQLTITLMTQRV